MAARVTHRSQVATKALFTLLVCFCSAACRWWGSGGGKLVVSHEACRFFSRWRWHTYLSAVILTHSEKYWIAARNIPMVFNETKKVMIYWYFSISAIDLQAPHWPVWSIHIFCLEWIATTPAHLPGQTCVYAIQTMSFFSIYSCVFACLPAQTRAYVGWTCCRFSL